MPSIPFLKRFTVFNVDQCENLPEDYAAVTTPPLPNTILPQAVARIVVSGADFRIGGDRAFYVRALDYVQVPPPRAYFDPINGHRTALHNLCHYIRSEKRLARDFSGSFGSKSYAREELVAEIGSAFTCAALGITPTVRHSDYIASWSGRDGMGAAKGASSTWAAAAANSKRVSQPSRKVGCKTLRKPALR